MATTPKRWCAHDFCCEFDPGSHNARYCPEHRCKRKAENARKRLTAEDINPEEVWKLQEERKEGKAKLTQAKNEWLVNNSKIVMFDLETFDLAADFGLIMVGCIKERGGETHTFVAHGDADEPQCILNIRNAIEEADYVVTYYGTKFDIPYLNTRLIIHNEKPIDEIRHIDLYYTVRHRLRLNRNRLQNVEEAILNSPQKTRILPGIWRRALQGDEEALDYIVDHCIKDVAILEDAFDKLRGFINIGATRLRRYGATY